MLLTLSAHLALDSLDFKQKSTPTFLNVSVLVRVSPKGKPEKRVWGGWFAWDVTPGRVRG